MVTPVRPDSGDSTRRGRPAPGHDGRSLPAAQQPAWHDDPHLPAYREELSHVSPMVRPEDLPVLRRGLARVAAGEALMLQAGDCAESLRECEPSHTEAKLDQLQELADLFTARTRQPVLRVGRLGGQFAKPRSAETEMYGNRELPVFRGHIINGEEPTAAARRPDPGRLLLAHRAATAVTKAVEYRRADLEAGPWTSHEALVIDYETALLRTDDATGVLYLGSTHLPWIGERTRQADGAHIHMLASVANPVGCKVGPGASPEAVVRVCDLLDPDRTEGRLVLIPRMGRDQVDGCLPGIVEAVAAAGHRPAWVIDPMHGNTVRTGNGLKTRHLQDIAAEVSRSRRVLESLGQHPGGLHLEVAAEPVTECVGGPLRHEDQLLARYTSLCDPRLNPEQAALLLEMW